MRGDEYQNILKLVVITPGFEQRPEQGTFAKPGTPLSVTVLLCNASPYIKIVSPSVQIKSALSVLAPPAMSYAVLHNHIVKLARCNSQSACSVFLHPSVEFEGFQEQVFLACFEVFQRL